MVEAVFSLAWKLYEQQVQEKLKGQHADWIAQRPTFTIMLTPPTPAQLNVIADALMLMVDHGVHQAIGPVVSIVDELDNSDPAVKRTKAHKAFRARVEIAYQAIKSMKSSAIALAQ